MAGGRAQRTSSVCAEFPCLSMVIPWDPLHICVCHKVRRHRARLSRTCHGLSPAKLANTVIRGRRYEKCRSSGTSCSVFPGFRYQKIPPASRFRGNVALICILNVETEFGFWNFIWLSSNSAELLMQDNARKASGKC